MVSAIAAYFLPTCAFFILAGPRFYKKILKKFGKFFWFFFSYPPPPPLNISSDCIQGIYRLYLLYESFHLILSKSYGDLCYDFKLIYRYVSSQIVYYYTIWEP